MKRFVSRHWSIRDRYNYSPLSSSDTQLENDAAACSRDAGCYSADDDAKELMSQRDSTHRRRWFHRRRRKKHREAETIVHVHESTAPSPCDDELEIAVEASPSNDMINPGVSYLRQCTLTGCSSTNSVHEVDIQSLDLATTINKAGLDDRRGARVFSIRPERRFAICEELEREMIMDNGMNLRKSRKNLVIRQVLHDLLLL